MEKILIIIPGISTNKLLPVISNNINKLMNFNYELSIEIYDYQNIVTNEFENFSNININKGNLNLYSVFMYYDNHVDNYDYIFVLLDDVEIKNLDLNKMVEYHNKYNLDMSSPSITHGSRKCFPNMKHKDCESIHIVRALELFCYLLKPNIYHKWCSIMTKENGYGWGIDFNLYSILKLRLGLIQPFTIKHLVRNSGSYIGIANKQMKNWFNQLDKNSGAVKGYNSNLLDDIVLENNEVNNLSI